MHPGLDLLFSSLPQPTAFIAFALLVVVSLALIFIGRKMAKTLVFVAGGLVVALITAALLYPYLGGPLTLIAAILGFVLGGLLAIFMLRLGIGVALGILGYTLGLSLGAPMALGIVVGMILFIIGLLLSDQILAFTTVLLGSLILIQTFNILGIPLLITTTLTAVIAALGLYTQLRRGKTQI